MSKVLPIYEVTSLGGTFTFSLPIPADGFYIKPDTAPVVLAANLTFNFSGTPNEGAQVDAYFYGIDLNGNTFTINGEVISEANALNGALYSFLFIDGAWGLSVTQNISLPNILDGDILIDGSTPITKLEPLTSGRIIVGSGANVPTAVAVTGDVTISNAGVTAISSGVIVNADVNASAAIDRSKLANGTASHVLINSGAGAFSSEATLSPVRGGLGLDASSSTGFVKVSSGVTSISSVYETLIVPVSFETGEVGTIFVDFPYACTILSYQFVCTKALAGTDAGTIQFADNSGTNMTGGLASIPASTAFGTRVGATITSGGSVAINDDIRITTAKTTAGGRGFVSITYTRVG